MVTNQEIRSPEFTGSAAVKATASAAFDILRGQGMFVSDYSPIRVKFDALAEFLENSKDISANDLRKAITANEAVFALVTEDDVEYVLTTRLGTSPVSNNAPSTHSLVERFITPLPKPERPVRPAPERARVDPNWATYSVPDYEDEDEEAYLSLPDEEEEVSVVVVPEAAEVEAAVEVEPVAAVEDEPVVEEVVVDEAAVEETAPATPAAKAAPAPAADFSGADDTALAAVLEERLAADPRIARFGDRWMAEDQVARLSRNDIRRIKDYISEQEQPLTDESLATDILNIRPNSADFENLKFAVNYRLGHEHRDFDFVGTNGQRFWSTTTLPQIGTTRRKPNDIGTDFRYLVDEVPTTVAHRSVSSVSHVLSFYEFVHGLLPYDLKMQQLLPKQVLPDQRVAVLTFEIPQFYTTYLVELRYPTPNRGGFILGLDDFYAESLVPGALISITATENDGHYTVEFLPGTNQSERLLDLDDRRSPRYHFRPTSFSCEVSTEWLVSEEKFPRLGSEKPLDDKIRRRPDAVVEATFERVGLEDGDNLLSSFSELLTAANVERPFSPDLLRATLDQHARVTSDDGDTFIYERG
jgi:hypothetical protein